MKVPKSVSLILTSIYRDVNLDRGIAIVVSILASNPYGNFTEKLISMWVLIMIRAMALGEYMAGVVEGEKNVIFVNISWGLGIGIIIDGKPYYGKSGFSGEFGHFPIFDNEILCHCGKKGCLETEASGMAIHRMVIERINNGESSILTEEVKDLNKLTLTDILNAVAKEDPLCIEIIEDVGYTLGKVYCRAYQYI